MKIFKKKQPVQTTQDVLQGAMARIGHDVDSLNAQREAALGVFIRPIASSAPLTKSFSSQYSSSGKLPSTPTSRRLSQRLP